MVRYFIVKLKDLPKNAINEELQKHNKTADDVIGFTTVNNEDLFVFYKE